MGLAREIERTKFAPYMMHGVFSFCFIGLTYNIARILNKQLHLYQRPPIMRGMMYISLLPTLIFSYFFTKDSYNRHIDKSLDRKAAGVSLEYCGRDKYTGKGELIQGIIRLKTAPI